MLQKRDYLRTISLCFEFGKTTELQSRSRDRFQTTNEQRSPDDLTCSEVKQRNLIGMDYRTDHAEHKFPGAPSAGFDCHSSSLAFLLFYRWKMGRANSTRFFLLPFNSDFHCCRRISRYARIDFAFASSPHKGQMPYCRTFSELRQRPHSFHSPLSLPILFLRHRQRKPDYACAPLLV